MSNRNRGGKSGLAGIIDPEGWKLAFATMKGWKSEDRASALISLVLFIAALISVIPLVALAGSLNNVFLSLLAAIAPVILALFFFRRFSRALDRGTAHSNAKRQNRF